MHVTGLRFAKIMGFSRGGLQNRMWCLCLGAKIFTQDFYGAIPFGVFLSSMKMPLLFSSKALWSHVKEANMSKKTGGGNGAATKIRTRGLMITN